MIAKDDRIEVMVLLGYQLFIIGEKSDENVTISTSMLIEEATCLQVIGGLGMMTSLWMVTSTSVATMP